MIVGGVMLGGLGVLAVWLLAAVFMARSGTAGASPTPNPSDFAYVDVKAAPLLQLTDQDGKPFALTSLRGQPVLVFFGYTHCPDVCPATVGIVNQAVADSASAAGAGAGPRAVFVSIDPERDNAAAMKSYVKYLPPFYTGLSGTADDVKANADGWGVKYAKVETGSANGYAMAHTADVYLVDAQGRLRAHFPFGTQAGPIAAALKALLAEAPVASGAPATASPSASAPSGAPSAAPSAALGALTVKLVSSGAWAGGPDPLILTVGDGTGALLDGTVPVDVTVTGAGGAAAGPAVRAVAVKPWGETVVYYVATVTMPSPGEWRLELRAADGRTGSVAVDAQDQGTSAALGAPAPDIHTPTLADVGGVVRAVTTQPNPDLRLSQTSTSDARAAGKPYVIVIDSARFKVSPLCGRALVMVRYLLDRWPDVAFIHLEPFEYQVITEEPVLSGTIANPPLNQWARAFGLGDTVWPAVKMPWAFVVDGQGIVRAKYQGIIGSSDVDIIISLMTNNGVIGG
jgi:protein SCO1/2